MVIKNIPFVMKLSRFVIFIGVYLCCIFTRLPGRFDSLLQMVNRKRKCSSRFILGDACAHCNYVTDRITGGMSMAGSHWDTCLPAAMVLSRP